MNGDPDYVVGSAQSYRYCFDGIAEGTVVAVSTLGAKKEKDFFSQGYNEMLQRIKPKAIIRYSDPFLKITWKERLGTYIWRGLSYKRQIEV